MIFETASVFLELNLISTELRILTACICHLFARHIILLQIREKFLGRVKGISLRVQSLTKKIK
jgi:hypothetical protein